ncbi:molybdenum ABC transporter permease [Sphingobacterium multivorum]|uniref:molybdenum ABC transporter permease n=1 Tax=Sphingobacterium multivorum TaxID=28454 RepID=UPI003DA51A9F
MDTITAQLVFGIILIVVGVGLVYWISRRKFYRRNGMGAEGFSSFEASVFTRFIEGFGKLIAYGLILVGAVCIWTYSQMKKDKEKQQKVKTEQPAQR